MTLIHPTAIISPDAEIDATASVGPYAIIEGPVRIGPRTRIAAHAQILGDTHLGADNVVHAGAILGDWPQHLAFKGAPTGVRIGDNNVFREHVTVHRPFQENQNTVIGNGCFFMASSHVAHDCVLGNDIIIANGTMLGGHVHVEDRAVLSGGVAVHQFVRIGRCSMIGGISRVVKDLPPYMMLEGNSRIVGINTVGMRRAGLAPEARTRVKRIYRFLFRSGLSVPKAIELMEVELGADTPEVREIVDFIRASVRGICRGATDCSTEAAQ